MDIKKLSLITSIVVITTFLAIGYKQKKALPNIDTSIFKKTPTERKHVPILMYHYVEYVTDERDFLREAINIPPHIFEKQLQTLKDAGYIFITPSELPKAMRDDSDKKYVIISFDDGYEDFYTDVLPILKKRNVKAVNYIVYNFMDTLNHMKRNQIKEVVKSNLVEIGAHTLNHRWLKDIDEAHNEIYLSKKKLEEEFGISVVSFAYPYGAYDEDIKKMVEEAGYTTAVVIKPNKDTTGYDLFELKRIRPGYFVGEELIERIESKK